MPETNPSLKIRRLMSGPRLLENLITLANNKAATDAIKLPMVENNQEMPPN